MTRLAGEIAGLQRARRHRAVIEQAKGVLMARRGCSADQAFRQLTEISQHTNTKVADVAASLLGTVSPVPADPDGGHPDESLPVLPDQDAARYHLACAAMAVARDGQAVADALLADGLRPLGASGVILVLRESAQAVCIAGASGVPRGLVSRWRRVPAEPRVVFLRALADGRPLWIDRAGAEAAGWSLLGDAPFRACLPVRRDAEVTGGVLVLWPADPMLDLSRRALVSALASAAGRRLDQLTVSSGSAVAAATAHWLEAVLEALPGSFALLCPAGDETEATDWRIAACSPEARDAAGRCPAELIGHRLLELYPHLDGTRLLRGYEEVSRTGRPLEIRTVDGPFGREASPVELRATRLGDGVLVTWRPEGPESTLRKRIAAVAEMAPAGWAEWNLQTGDIGWTRQNSDLLGTGEPMTLASLHRCAAGLDAATLAAAVHTMIRNGTATDLTVAVRHGYGPRRTRIALEPVLDRRGSVIGAVGAFATEPGTTGPGADGSDGHVPSATAPDGSTDASTVPAAALQHMAAEIQRLRAEQRAQALVDQARGFLAVRLGCSLTAALDHLTRTARQRGTTVAEVAARVVGDGDPPPPATPARHADAVRDGRPVRARAPATSFPDVRDGNALAKALWADGLRALGASGVLFGVLEPDGAVRLVGTHGLPADLVSAWQRTPGSLNVAYLRAVATDTPLWITREDAEAQGYQLLGEGELRACLPLHEQGRIFGVASVLWPVARPLPAEIRQRVATLVAAAGRRLSELLRTSDTSPGAISPAAHWAETLVAALPPSYALLRPIRDPTGEILDWRLDCCSPETLDVSGRPAAEVTGRTVLELYPHTEAAGIFDIYAAALRRGTVATWGPEEFDVTTARGPVTVTMSVRASRFGDGVLVNWQRRDDDRLARRLRLLERAADCGWAEWDLSGGADRWSPALYDILRRDPRQGPLKFGVLPRHVVPEDQRAAAELVRRVTRMRRPADGLLRFRRHGEVIAVRVVARPVAGADGRLAGVRAVLRRCAVGVDAAAPATTIDLSRFAR